MAAGTRTSGAPYGVGEPFCPRRGLRYCEPAYRTLSKFSGYRPLEYRNQGIVVMEKML